MADYHPLIARAVAGLDKNSGENRRALYERARVALVGQLRGVQPALQESEITLERLALEEAIRRVEGDAARAARAGIRPTLPPLSWPSRPPVPEPPFPLSLEEYGQLEPQAAPENLWALPLDGPPEPPALDERAAGQTTADNNENVRTQRLPKLPPVTAIPDQKQKTHLRSLLREPDLLI